MRLVYKTVWAGEYPDQLKPRGRRSSTGFHGYIENCRIIIFATGQ